MTNAEAPVRDGGGRAAPREDEPPPAEALLDEMNHPGTGPERRDRLRVALVEAHASMVESIARRYGHRGEPLEDIRQVAYLGLVMAINRFDPERGDSFHAYAYPVILGEVRRHFRDRTWGIRVTRRIQELRPRLVHATQVFSQENGRSPTPSELAGLLGLGLEEVAEAVIAWDSYNPLSLDAPAEGGSESETQTQIAEQFGISQMHVSRLLSKSLLQLRHGMLPA